MTWCWILSSSSCFSFCSLFLAYWWWWWWWYSYMRCSLPHCCCCCEDSSNPTEATKMINISITGVVCVGSAQEWIYLFFVCFEGFVSQAIDKGCPRVSDFLYKGGPPVSAKLSVDHFKFKVATFFESDNNNNNHTPTHVARGGGGKWNPLTLSEKEVTRKRVRN